MQEEFNNASSSAGSRKRRDQCTCPITRLELQDIRVYRMVRSLPSGISLRLRATCFLFHFTAQSHLTRARSALWRASGTETRIIVGVVAFVSSDLAGEAIVSLLFQSGSRGSLSVDCIQCTLLSGLAPTAGLRELRGDKLHKKIGFRLFLKCMFII